MRVGFIGLGIMGRPMAKHLLDAGHQLTVWNRSRPGIDDLVAAGAAEGASPADVAANERGRVHDGRRLAGRRGGGAGRAGHHRGGSLGLVHIDMSTISPAVTRAIAAEYAKGHRVAGRAGHRRRGRRDQRHALDHGRWQARRVRPLPAAVRGAGQDDHLLRPAGAGQTIKLCNQVVVAVTNLAVCEALVLAKKAGVPPRRCWRRSAAAPRRRGSC